MNGIPRTDIVHPSRCAVVFSPAWPIIAAIVQGASGRGQRFDPRAPLVVFHQQRVLCCSPLAWSQGVRPGQRRRQAQGICPHLIIVPYDLDRDGRFFEPVIRSIGTLVPLIDVDSPGSLLLATRGPARYVGGDEALAIRLVALASAGVNDVVHSPEILDAGGGIGVGIADGRIAATLAARTAVRQKAPLVVAKGALQTAAFLAPFSVRVLVGTAGCSAQLIDLLERLGLRHLGDVANLSITHLSDRFGTMGAILHRLASGTDDTPPSVSAPPPDLCATRVFDDAVQQLDVLIFAAKTLADELASYFHERGQVCTRLQVEAETEYGENSQRLWYRSEGMQASAMLERIRWQLDGWINGSGAPSAGITLLRLTPMEVRADVGTQESFWGGRSQADDTATRSIARVIALLGPSAISLPSWRGGRDPQRIYSMVPVADIGSSDKGSLARQLVSPPTATVGLWPGSLPAPAPSIVHHKPLPVTVLDIHGHSVSVSGRGLVSAAPATFTHSGSTSPVVAWAGPWPVEERWWDERNRRAARFQLVVETCDGQDAYLVELAAGSWWLTGQYA